MLSNYLPHNSDTLEFTIVRRLEDGRYELDLGRGRRLRANLYRCPECQQVKTEADFDFPMWQGRAKREEAVQLCRSCYHESEQRERERFSHASDRERKIYRLATARNHAAKRAAALAAATPPWVDRAAIALIYREAREKTEILGIVQHVDHIWPIQHPEFCGLHVPWNLRVIDARDNCRKNNKRPDEIAS